jgi:hypothetical protein
VKAASSPRQSAKFNVKAAADVEEAVTKLLSAPPGQQNIHAAMTQLRRNPRVESAHETAPRKLIR